MVVIKPKKNLKDFLNIKQVIAWDLPESVGESFSFLEKHISILLQGERTHFVISQLSEYFYPIWRYYINCQLNILGVPDGQEREDHFYDCYLQCIELLPKLRYKEGAFNQIKRFYNKSISGLLYNAVRKVPKSQTANYLLDRNFEMLKDLLDTDDTHKEFEFDYDKAKVEKHIQQEFEVYFEFCSALLGTYLHTSLEIYKVRFVKAVYKHFYNTGKLLPGITFFKQKYMRFL